MAAVRGPFTGAIHPQVDMRDEIVNLNEYMQTLKDIVNAQQERVERLELELSEAEKKTKDLLENEFWRIKGGATDRGHIRYLYPREWDEWLKREGLEKDSDLGRDEETTQQIEKFLGIFREGRASS